MTTKATAQHTHGFAVDASCECGVMLSELIRTLAREKREAYDILRSIVTQQNHAETLGQAAAGLDLCASKARALLARIEGT